LAALVERLHATAIAAGGRGALILGSSGSGKSDLALRCMTLAASPLIPSAPACLVADDQVILTREGGKILLSAPASISRKLEVRGIGILSVDALDCAPLALLVDLVAPAEIERLPDPPPKRHLLGLPVPLLRLAAFEASAAAKLLIALAQAPPPTFEG
jgi:HPr kinase/phosphorylase